MSFSQSDCVGYLNFKINTFLRSRLTDVTNTENQSLGASFSLKTTWFETAKQETPVLAIEAVFIMNCIASIIDGSCIDSSPWTPYELSNGCIKNKSNPKPVPILVSLWRKAPRQLVEFGLSVEHGQNRASPFALLHSLVPEMCFLVMYEILVSLHTTD